MDKISTSGIIRNLRGGSFERAFPVFYIDVYEQLGSTNDEIRNLAINGEPEGRVVIAESQTSGRGRMGRSYYCPSESGLYMSILLRPKCGVQGIPLITPRAAVAAAKAIEAVSGQESQIKWVNDIYVNNRKVCGILTEAAFSGNGQNPDYVVLGIGVNVYPPKEGFPEEIAERAGSIFGEAVFREFDRGINRGNSQTESDVRNRLAAEILNQFAAVYSDMENNSFIDEYRKRMMLLGQKIDVIKGNKTRSALALDIDDSCRLKVKYDDGSEEYLSSGEISIAIKNYIKKD